MQPKRLVTEAGSIDLEVPRDRAGTPEPQIVRKGQRPFDGIDKIVIGLYAHGMSVRDIQGTGAKRRWPGELSVRLAVYGRPRRIALLVGDVFALRAFERGLASWNVLLRSASGAGNRLHPLRYSRRYEYGRQNT